MILLSDDMLPTIKALVYEFSGEISKSEQLSVIIDYRIIFEAVERASKSITYHENTNNPNHFKEAGHLCHWLVKLKPISIVETESRFDEVIKYINGALLKFKNGKDLEKEYQRNNERADMKKKRSKVSVLINELVSTKLCLRFINKSETEKLKSEIIGKPKDVEKLKKKLNTVESRFRNCDEYTLNISNSFREHTYSARGTAMLFELGFASDYL